MDERLEVIAHLEGAHGVLQYFKENRKKWRELLESLGRPILLNTQDASNRVLSIQKMKIPAQRNIWLFLLEAMMIFSPTPVKVFAEKYLSCTKCDPVCKTIAKLITQGNATQATKEESKAFTEQMHRLDFCPMIITCENEKVRHKLEKNTSSSKGKGPVKGHIRPRQDSAGLQHSAYESQSKQPRLNLEQSNPPPNPATLQSGALSTPKPTTIPPQINLSKELADIARELRKKLENVDGSNRVSVQKVSEETFQILKQVMYSTKNETENELQFVRLIEVLELSKSNEEVLFYLSNILMEANWSTRFAGCFMEHAIAPRIVLSSCVISRILLQTVLHFKAKYSSVIIDNLIAPIVTCASIGSAQAEAVTRIFREGLETSQHDELLSKILTLSEKKTEHKMLLENEAVILVLQNLLNIKSSLSSQTISHLIKVFEISLDSSSKSCGMLCKSIKFGTLLFTLVSKYSELCSPHVDQLESIAKQLTSFMAKSALRSIQKLKT